MQNARGRSIELELNDGESSGNSGGVSASGWTSIVEGLPAIYLSIGAVLITLVFSYLQFSTQAILDVDGYYHIKWSQLLSQGMQHGVFPPAFPWLPLTILNEQDYVDHHLLFHILLIPFTWFDDLRIGAKVAATLFGSLAVFSCYWLIVRYHIRYAPVWLVALLACSAPFLYRLSMTRAQSVSIIFMVIGISLLFERKYLWLAPLAFLYVWTYSMFVTLCAAAVIWAAVIWWSEARIEWRPVVWTGIGVVAGFIINPYFPQNVVLFIEHLLIKVRVTNFSTSVGMEWYPYESWYFFGSCLVAFAAMMIGYVSFNSADRKQAARPLFFLIFSTLLLIATFRSRRFVEYWPPFAVLFAAFSLQPVLAGIRYYTSYYTGRPTGNLPEGMWQEAQPFSDPDADVTANRHRESWNFTVAAMVAAVLAVPLFFNVTETAKMIAADPGPYTYQGAMGWIRQNVPRGEIVFNADWDDFPMMFFYDADHRYVSGLDPTYLLDHQPELSTLYEQITLGKEPNPAPIIRNRFGASYIFTDSAEIHKNLYSNAVDSGWCEEVYADEHGAVLRIFDQQRNQPPLSPGRAATADGLSGNENTDEASNEQ